MNAVLLIPKIISSAVDYFGLLKSGSKLTLAHKKGKLVGPAYYQKLAAFEKKCRAVGCDPNDLSGSLPRAFDLKAREFLGDKYDDPNINAIVTNARNFLAEAMSKRLTFASSISGLGEIVSAAAPTEQLQSIGAYAAMTGKLLGATGDDVDEIMEAVGEDKQDVIRSFNSTGLFEQSVKALSTESTDSSEEVEDAVSSEDRD